MTVLNKQASVEKTNNHPVVEKFVPRLREGALIGFVAVFLYLMMALLTYDQADPGWSRTGTGAAVANSGGPTGAWLADIFLSLFVTCFV